MSPKSWYVREGQICKYRQMLYIKSPTLFNYSRANLLISLPRKYLWLQNISSQKGGWGESQQHVNGSWPESVTWAPRKSSFAFPWWLIHSASSHLSANQSPSWGVLTNQRPASSAGAKVWEYRPRFSVVTNTNVGWWNQTFSNGVTFFRIPAIINQINN